MVNWIQCSTINVAAPTGTVMLPTLSLIIGIQFFITAIEIDLRSIPKEPLSQQLNTQASMKTNKNNLS